jgi:hypothetical protein
MPACIATAMPGASPRNLDAPALEAENDNTGRSRYDPFMHRGAAIVICVGALGCGGGDWGSWNPHDSTSQFGITALWSFGPEDVWAGSTVMMHNDGTGFVEVDTPPLGQVLDFMGFAPDDLYAVAGDLLHWDGTAWTVVEGPSSTSFGFTAIWGTSGDDLWVGDELNGQVHHWNGTTWTTGITQTTAVDDLWGSSPTDIYACGIFAVSHWDGVSWTEVDGVDRCSGVDGTGASDVWMVDDSDVLAHWDGVSWTDTTPDDDDFENDLLRIFAVGPDDVWAVGGDGLIAHWDGSGWSQEQVGDFPYYPNLEALHGSSATDIWIGGYHYDDGGGVHPVLLSK